MSQLGIKKVLQKGLANVVEHFFRLLIFGIYLISDVNRIIREIVFLAKHVNVLNKIKLWCACNHAHKHL